MRILFVTFIFTLMEKLYSLLFDSILSPVDVLHESGNTDHSFYYYLSSAVFFLAYLFFVFFAFQESNGDSPFSTDENPVLLFPLFTKSK